MEDDRTGLPAQTPAAATSCTTPKIAMTQPQVGKPPDAERALAMRICAPLIATYVLETTPDQFLRT